MASDRSTLLIPPLNFSMVSKGVYRSGLPDVKNLAFLRTLRLRTVLYLGRAEYPRDIKAFLDANGIRLALCAMDGNREPFVSISTDAVHRALELVADAQHHPMLIHCHLGKHRTSCVVGCLRKLEGWSLTSIFDEYRMFTGTKTRMLDLQFIEQYAPLPSMARLQLAPCGAAPARTSPQ